MADHPHAAAYRGTLSAFNSGDVAAMEDAMSDDVVWWEIGASNPIRGKDALRAAMQTEMGKWEITAELHDVVSNDEHLLALVTARATRDGETLEYRTVEIHHVDENGKITERWAFSDDTQAIIDFFA